VVEEDIMAKMEILSKAPVERRVALGKILVATDFSPVSEKALEFAATIAREFESTICVTHIIRVDAYPMVPPEVAWNTALQDKLRAKVEFDKTAKSSVLNGVPYETVIEEGSMWAAIENLVEKFEIDLVVVGTHGASGIKKVLLGSIRKFTRNRPPEDDQTLVVVSFDQVNFEVRSSNEELRMAR